MTLDFRTILPAVDFPFSVSYRHQMVALGSCFAEHIGHRLQARKFRLLLNPFGILYQPVTIADNLERLAQQDPPFGEQDLVQRDELWFSWAHHGCFAHSDPEKLLETINAHAIQARQWLQKVQIVFLTLGSAYVFRHKASGRIVANCHKIPAAHFERYRLSIDQTIEACQRIVSALHQLHPHAERLQFVWTVSPVRHLRDGLIANQRSKATLVLAVDHIVAHHDRSHYFPAFELVLDDLRDYRFTAPDMAHPNELAQEYIWRYFCQTLLDPEELPLMRQIEKINQALAHRPLYPHTQAHRAFLQGLHQQIQNLLVEYPDLDFRHELAQIQRQMADGP